jgi:hypothetical protein
VYQKTTFCFYGALNTVPFDKVQFSFDPRDWLANGSDEMADSISFQEKDTAEIGGNPWIMVVRSIDLDDSSMRVNAFTMKELVSMLDRNTKVMTLLNSTKQYDQMLGLACLRGFSDWTDEMHGRVFSFLEEKEHIPEAYESLAQAKVWPESLWNQLPTYLTDQAHQESVIRALQNELIREICLNKYGI